MKLLLDTHIVLWALLGDEALPSFARRAVMAPANLRFVSVASLWEVAIKRSTGKLDFPLDPVELVERVRQDLQAQVLPIEASHLRVLETQTDPDVLAWWLVVASIAQQEQRTWQVRRALLENPAVLAWAREASRDTAAMKEVELRMSASPRPVGTPRQPPGS